MPTVHSSHGMLGMGNYIYVIGGLLTKKVERYDINENSWENLNELNENRIWPSCFGYNNKYIYVFGGSKNNLDEEDIDIERINISSLENKWKKIKLNYKTDIKFPILNIKSKNGIKNNNIYKTVNYRRENLYKIDDNNSFNKIYKKFQIYNQKYDDVTKYFNFFIKTGNNNTKMNINKKINNFKHISSISKPKSIKYCFNAFQRIKSIQ